MKQLRSIDKRGTLEILQLLDSYLEEYEKKFPVYLIGGSALILKGKQADSKDIDFITSSKGYLALTNATKRLKKEYGVRIDIFSDGHIINYRYENYYLRSEKVLSLKHLDIYVLDYADVILTKCLAGRERDMLAIEKLKEQGIVVEKEELVRRFKRVVPDIGKEDEIKNRFENFLKAYFVN